MESYPERDRTDYLWANRGSPFATREPRDSAGVRRGTTLALRLKDWGGCPWPIQLLPPCSLSFPVSTPREPERH